MANLDAAPLRIGVLSTSVYGYARALHKGILHYAESKPGWQLVRETYASPAGVEFLLVRGRLDGLLCEPFHPDVLRPLQTWKKPLVVMGASADPAFLASAPRVALDNQAIGRFAFHHLRGIGLLSFAYLGLSGRWVSQARQAGFQAEAEAAGVPVWTHDVASYKDYHRFQNTVLPWMKSLPRPLALFAMNDELGGHAIRVATDAGLVVPDDVAVLGVDNDSLTCRLTHPALSSIDPGTWEMGRQAAERLDSALQGGGLTPPLSVVSPQRVVVRASTDVLSVSHPGVRRALSLIRDEACNELRVEDLVRRSGMSRRSLEEAFQRTVGCGPKEMILRRRLVRAKELLCTSTHYIPDIAAECGWPSAAHFSVIFKKRTGMTPTEYRRTWHV